MAGTDILFRYSVKVAGLVSIGVFADTKCEGEQLAVLSSAVHHEAGEYVGYWNGKNKRGDIVSKPLERGIISQTSNVKAEFQGAVGNNSKAITGAGAWDMVHNPPSMCFAVTPGGRVAGYVASAYIEGVDVSFRKFFVDDPLTCIRLHERDEFATRFVATDGNLVYWFGFQGKYGGMITATRVSDDSDYVFPFGTRIKFDHSTYESAIGLNDVREIVNGETVQRGNIYGGTVQRNGRFAVAAYQDRNQLWVLDKTTGEKLFEVSVNAPRHLGFTTDNVLWVIHDIPNPDPEKDPIPVCEKFTVTPEGVFTPTGVFLSDVVDPMYVASNFDGSVVDITDGSRTNDCTTTARHQIHSFNGATGEKISKFGRTEGYEDARYYKDKLCLINTKVFEDTSIGQAAPWSAYEPVANGARWVGDIGNNRSARFSATGEWLSEIRMVGYHYSAACDPVRTQDVYANLVRFKVGYPNLTWEQTHNYVAYRKRLWDSDYTRMRNVTTFPSGRTYYLAATSDTSTRLMRKQLIEVADTKLVETGIFTEHFNVVLNENGSLTILEPTYNGPTLEFGRVGDVQVVNQRFLTSDPTDPNQFPTWGEKVLVEPIPAVQELDPIAIDYLIGANQRLQSGGWVVFNKDCAYDGKDEFGRRKYKIRGTGKHVGIVKDGKYIGQASDSTPIDFEGLIPSNGDWDNGNDVQGVGNIMQVVGDFIFWRMHNEFRVGKQTAITEHLSKYLLLIGIYGVENRADIPQTPAPLGLSSNGTSGNYVQVGEDIYHYSNTEGYFGGVHRWRYSNLSSIKYEFCTPQLGTLGTHLVGVDTLAGLPKAATLVDGTAGWFRSPATDTIDFRVTTSRFEAGQLDLSVRSNPANALNKGLTPVRSSTVGCHLPAMTAPGQWRLSGTARYLYNAYDESGDTAPFEIPDKSGKVILRLLRTYQNDVRGLYVNGQFAGSQSVTAWYDQMLHDALIDAGVDEQGLYVQYAGLPLFRPAGPADPGADINAPAAYQFRTQLTANSGREFGMDFTNVRFLDKQAPVVPTTFNATTPPTMPTTVPAPPLPARQILTGTLSQAGLAAYNSGKGVVLNLKLKTGVVGPLELIRKSGTGGQLTPDQLAQIQALSAPVYVQDANGVTGYQLLDDALAAAVANRPAAVHLNKTYLSSLSGTAWLGDTNVLYGGQLELDPSQEIDFGGGLVYDFRMAGTALVNSGRADFHQSDLPVLKLGGAATEAHLYNTPAPQLDGVGTVYLYGSTPDPVTVASGITVVDRRGGGQSGTPRDPFAVGDVATITAAVTDASNIWADGDLTDYGSPALQDAGAPPAVAGQNSTILVGTADVVTLDEFDYPDAGGGGAWRYRYGRRNDGTSGWTRTPKG